MQRTTLTRMDPHNTGLRGSRRVWIDSRLVRRLSVRPKRFFTGRTADGQAAVPRWLHRGRPDRFATGA